LWLQKFVKLILPYLRSNFVDHTGIGVHRINFSYELYEFA
jgi:hypothetical protein